MAMSEKERKQLMILLIAIAVAGPGLFWVYWRQPQVAELQAWAVEIDSLQAQIDTAKADLAQGTVESLRANVQRYERALGVMRELVPVGEEVTSLIDSVSSRSQLRGVEITAFDPQTPEQQGPFQVNRFQFVVIGPYDALGEFLADIGSLRRIMVPYDISLDVTRPEDLTGMLVEEGRTYLTMQFMIRTFVKTGAAAPAAGVTDGA